MKHLKLVKMNYSHSEQLLPSSIIYMVLHNGKKIAAKEDAVLTFIENNYDYSDDLDHVQVYELCKAKLDAEFQEVMTRYYNEVVCKSSEFKSANREQQTIRRVG